MAYYERFLTLFLEYILIQVIYNKKKFFQCVSFGSFLAKKILIDQKIKMTEKKKIINL